MRSLIPLVVLVTLVGAGATAQQTRPAQPDFKVETWGFAADDFTTRMAAYARLREKLQKGLPALAVTDEPRQIYLAVDSLGQRIRVARDEADRGDIFTREIAAAFRKALLSETTGSTCAALLEDNPGHITHRINAAYPRTEPLSTVPVGILNLLPALPDDVHYRFSERDLLLHDTRANVIIDRLSNAIRCR